MNAAEFKAELLSKGTKTSFTREESQNLLQKQQELTAHEEKLFKLSKAVEDKLKEKQEYFDFVSRRRGDANPPQITKRNKAEDELESLRTLLEQKRAENAAGSQRFWPSSQNLARQKISEISSQLLPRAEKLKEAELSLLAKRQLLDHEKDEKEENLYVFSKAND